MKHSLLFITLLFSPILLMGQQAESAQEENIIYWSENQKLVWTDFDGLAERYSEHAAFSVVGFESRMNFDGKEYRALIKTYFDQDESWSKTWTALLLMHEQGHFDLAEIHARKFRKRVMEEMHTGRLTTSSFKQLHEEAMNELDRVQKRYDQSTNYSMDYREQLKWNDRIAEELQQLSNFADPELVVQVQ